MITFNICHLTVDIYSRKNTGKFYLNFFKTSVSVCLAIMCVWCNEILGQFYLTSSHNFWWKTMISIFFIQIYNSNDDDAMTFVTKIASSIIITAEKEASHFSSNNARNFFVCSAQFFLCCTHHTHIPTMLDRKSVV